MDQLYGGLSKILLKLKFLSISPILNEISSLLNYFYKTVIHKLIDDALKI